VGKDVIIPRLGSSDESDEVRVLRWLKARDAPVQKGEALLEVETDKVNVEIEAPTGGRLSEVRAQEGDFVKCGAVVAVIDEDSSTS
jgi:pyruvate/2-oxoglutarate dehydrogenase complex dihydrolipoamide acyltransferase (E2) component